MLFLLLSLSLVWLSLFRGQLWAVLHGESHKRTYIYHVEPTNINGYREPEMKRMAKSVYSNIVLIYPVQLRRDERGGPLKAGADSSLSVPLGLVFGPMSRCTRILSTDHATCHGRARELDSLSANA